MKCGPDLGQSCMWAPLELPDMLQRWLNEGGALGQGLSFAVELTRCPGGERKSGCRDTSFPGFLSQIRHRGPYLSRLGLLTCRLSRKNVLKHTEKIYKIFIKSKFSKTHCKVECLDPAEFCSMCKATWGRKIMQGSRKSRSKVLVCSFEKNTRRAIKGR